MASTPSRLHTPQVVVADQREVTVESAKRCERSEFWLFLMVSKFLKTKVALVKVNPLVASAAIPQNPETIIGTQCRASVKLQLFFFTVILGQQIRVDGTCWISNKCCSRPVIRENWFGHQAI